MNIFVISDYDSRIKWGVSLAKLLKNKFNCGKPYLFYKEANLHLIKNYFNDINCIKYENINSCLSMYNFSKDDIVIVALGGMENARIISNIKSINNSPISITGFNGLVDSSDPYGLLCRYGADVICVNTPSDLIGYNLILKQLNLCNRGLILTGYIRTYINKIKTINNISEEKKTDAFLYVEQPGILKTKRRIEYLCDKLINIATLNKNKKLYIKLRDSGINNIDKPSQEEIFRKRKLFKMKNIILSNESIEDLAKNIDFCLTFSSTVGLEYLSLNKNVGFISDFGIGKHLGNQPFLGSDLYISLDCIATGIIPTANELWIKNNVLFNNKNEIYNKIEELIKFKRPNPDVYFNVNKPPFLIEEKTKHHLFRDIF